MANGGPPPGGCPACEEKIILNGDITARVLDATCERIDAFVIAGNKFPDAHKLVEMANKLEDDAFAFSKEVLKQIGFQGPWPHSMS
jgi:hypothetical protein